MGVARMYVRCFAVEGRVRGREGMRARWRRERSSAEAGPGRVKDGLLHAVCVMADPQLRQAHVRR